MCIFINLSAKTKWHYHHLGCRKNLNCYLQLQYDQNFEEKQITYLYI